jgi:hypothetical protein
MEKGPSFVGEKAKPTTTAQVASSPAKKKKKKKKKVTQGATPERSNTADLPKGEPSQMKEPHSEAGPSKYGQRKNVIEP